MSDGSKPSEYRRRRRRALLVWLAWVLAGLVSGVAGGVFGGWVRLTIAGAWVAVMVWAGVDIWRTRPSQWGPIRLDESAAELIGLTDDERARYWDEGAYLVPARRIYKWARKTYW